MFDIQIFNKIKKIKCTSQENCNHNCLRPNKFIYMKIIFYIFCFTCLIGSQAQETIIKKYKSGEIASKETKMKWPDNNMQGFKEEKVEVFNKKGERIFEGHRRNYAGHSSVYLTYHDNGGVKKIECSSAPDGGIQWYKSTHLLDENGNITFFSEDSYDNQHKLITLTPHTENKIEQKEERKEEKKQPEKQSNACATPMATQVVIYNRSKKPVQVALSYKSDGANISYTKKISSKDSLQTKEYINAEKFAEPQEIFNISVFNKKTGKYESISFSAIPLKVYYKSSQHKVYQYYLID